MAKYTETFLDYLNNGNAFPDSFKITKGYDSEGKQIIDYDETLCNRFFARYCDCEIGYETEDLFKIKFEAIADAKIPLYRSAISTLVTSDKAIADPYKTTTQENGNTRTTTTDLPFDASTSSPSAIVASDKQTNYTTTKGWTFQEAVAWSDWNEQIRDMFERLLNEFSDLFMKVY